MFKSLAVVFFSFLAVFALVTVACAQDYSPMTATIVALKGEVQVTKNGGTMPFQAKVGDILANGDKIETKMDSDVELKTENGNFVNLGPQSQIIISELSINKATGDYRNVMDAKFGKIQARVEAKIKDHAKSKFEIKTPVAICGARGTVFFVVVGADGATQIFVASGSVNFMDPAGQNTFVVVENAAAAVTAAGGAVTELTGAEKDAVLAEYNAFVAAQGALPGGETPPGVVNPPSQQDDPQSLTEVTPAQNPSQS